MLKIGVHFQKLLQN